MSSGRFLFLGQMSKIQVQKQFEGTADAMHHKHKAPVFYNLGMKLSKQLFFSSITPPWNAIKMYCLACVSLTVQFIHVYSYSHSHSHLFSSRNILHCLSGKIARNCRYWFVSVSWCSLYPQHKLSTHQIPLISLQSLLFPLVSLLSLSKVHFLQSAVNKDKERLIIELCTQQWQCQSVSMDADRLINDSEDKFTF